jgi:hypothetical protein
MHVHLCGLVAEWLLAYAKCYGTTILACANYICQNTISARRYLPHAVPLFPLHYSTADKNTLCHMDIFQFEKCPCDTMTMCGPCYDLKPKHIEI